MTDEEINNIVSGLLRERFRDLRFERSIVKSEQDFDGSSVIRVTAHFNTGDVPANRLIDARHDMRSELIRRGEERYVFVDIALTQDQYDVADEDVE